jgi:DNA (cytosine-5)-methyltransferase 1
MRLLDLFSGAGGAAMGYHRVGFEVVGVDHTPQKRYPFEFHCADAFAFLEKHGQEFDVIHGSPPCQAYSVATPDKSKHPNLVPSIRKALQRIGKPYIIENVPGAPLHFPFVLCGTMFGLVDESENLYFKRHRLFESSPMLLSLGECTCRHVPVAHVSGHMGKLIRHTRRAGQQAGSKGAKVMMGIDWMTRDELAQAIPPAYTEWIGRRLLEALS